MPRIRYDWVKIQEYYDAGHTMRQCQSEFGFATQAWDKAIRRGAVKSRPRKKPISYYLVKDQKCSSSNLKMRLIAEGLLQNRCYTENCPSTSIWVEKPLIFQLDHINGIETDNRIENLRLLCPNCHSQTPTYGSRNWVTKT